MKSAQRGFRWEGRKGEEKKKKKKKKKKARSESNRAQAQAHGSCGTLLPTLVCRWFVFFLSVSLCSALLCNLRFFELQNPMS